VDNFAPGRAVIASMRLVAHSRSLRSSRRAESPTIRLKLGLRSSILPREAVPRVVRAATTNWECGAMKITEVRVNLQHEEVLKAFVSITLDDEFVVRGLKVIQKTEGRFVAMPNRKRRDGSYQDVAHPINRHTRNYMEATVLAAYDEAVGQVVGFDPRSPGNEDDDGDETAGYSYTVQA
jgi:stage V sporulation protein G